MIRKRALISGIAAGVIDSQILLRRLEVRQHSELSGLKNIHFVGVFIHPLAQSTVPDVTHLDRSVLT